MGICHLLLAALTIVYPFVGFTGGRVCVGDATGSKRTVTVPLPAWCDAARKRLWESVVPKACASICRNGDVPPMLCARMPSLAVSANVAQAARALPKSAFLLSDLLAIPASFWVLPWLQVVDLPVGLLGCVLSSSAAAG